MTNPVMTLVPVMAFLALLLAVGFIANRSLRKSEDFEPITSSRTAASGASFSR